MQSYNLHVWIERNIQASVRRLAKTRPVVLMTGARQTGKTSLLRHLFPDRRFVSLDDPRLAELADHDPETFFKQFPPPLIIDEVQYAPGVFRYIKLLVDAHRQQYGQFLLTGSQKLQLMHRVSESLAGRVAVVELETLAKPEVTGRRPALPVEDLLFIGGYPELHASAGIDVREFYRSYVGSYLERDVRSFLNVSNLRDFGRFLRACALRSGQLLNKAELGRDVGIAASTVAQWLSVLQATNVVLFLEPWFSNAGKSLVKTPKLYFADTGLMCYLIDLLNPQELQHSPYLGAIWETFVFSELRKAQTIATGHWSCNFWATRSREVDFLVHHGGRFELFEAKSTSHADRHDAAGVAEAARSLGQPNILRSAVICRTRIAYPITPTVSAWPVDNLWDIP